MEVNNKYYTPSIEEFHVGFEYESSEFGRKIWIEEVFELDWDNGNELLDIYNEGYQCTHIRVKYLDKEDIESLGFEYYRTEGYVFFRKKEYIIMATPDYTHLCIFDENYPYAEMNGIENTSIFKGVIQNKSELKALLKQLGIDE